MALPLPTGWIALTSVTGAVTLTVLASQVYALVPNASDGTTEVLIIGGPSMQVTQSVADVLQLIVPTWSPA
jgi:hypothetical protein